MPEQRIDNNNRSVTARTVIGGLDAVTVVEHVDRQDRSIQLRFHGEAGAVVIAGHYDDVYALILSADRQLGGLYRPEGGER